MPDFHDYEINARTYRPPIKKYEGGPWKYAHWKRDGHFLRLMVNIRGDKWDLTGNTWEGCTRRPTDVSWELNDCWCSLNSTLRGIQRTPGQWIILCEMWYPGKPASYLKTGFKEYDKNLQVEAFAFLRVPEYEIGELAYLSLEECSEIAVLHDIPFVPYAINVTKGCEIEKLYEFDINKNEEIEGYMLKSGNLVGWEKYKPTKTIDLIVTGFLPGEGKYAGQVGSLLLSTYEGYEVASASGMTDEMRLWMSNNPCVGLVCEVEYQLIGSQGRLRHPVFKHWRDDKFQNECSVSQDPDLERWWKQYAR